MKKLWVILFSISIFAFLTNQTHGQKIEQIKTHDLEEILKNPENKLFVVNFWATWCPPCVKELPRFETVSKEYDEGKVRFLLVSLDFPSQIKDQLIPFLGKNEITMHVSVMMDMDYNSWINKVDPSWQGNIPATLIFNNHKKQRYFYPGELDEPGLRKVINSLL